MCAYFSCFNYTCHSEVSVGMKPLLCGENICSCLICSLVVIAAVHSRSFSENSGYCRLCDTERFCGKWNRETANCGHRSAGLIAVSTGALAHYYSLIFYSGNSSVFLLPFPLLSCASPTSVLLCCSFWTV